MLPRNSAVSWGLHPVCRLSTFSASLKTKWFESFEVFLATERNNLTSLGIRLHSAEKISGAQGHGSWLCEYSVIWEASSCLQSTFGYCVAGVARAVSLRTTLLCTSSFSFLLPIVPPESHYSLSTYMFSLLDIFSGVLPESVHTHTHTPDCTWKCETI